MQPSEFLVPSTQLDRSTSASISSMRVATAATILLMLTMAGCRTNVDAVSTADTPPLPPVPADVEDAGILVLPDYGETVHVTGSQTISNSEYQFLATIGDGDPTPVTVFFSPSPLDLAMGEEFEITQVSIQDGLDGTSKVRVSLDGVHWVDMDLPDYLGPPM